MKVVLDTNILLQAIAHNSRLRPIWTAFLVKAYELHLTTSILLEYEEQIARRTSPEVSRSIVSLIDSAPNAHLIAVYFEWNAIIADPDDNKFFDAAIAAGADYLVTNDNHFNAVKSLSFPKINVINAEEFLFVLSSDANL